MKRKGYGRADRYNWSEEKEHRPCSIHMVVIRVNMKPWRQSLPVTVQGSSNQQWESQN